MLRTERRAQIVQRTIDLRHGCAQWQYEIRDFFTAGAFGTKWRKMKMTQIGMLFEQEKQEAIQFADARRLVHEFYRG